MDALLAAGMSVITRHARHASLMAASNHRIVLRILQDEVEHEQDLRSPLEDYEVMMKAK